MLRRLLSLCILGFAVISAHAQVPGDPATRPNLAEYYGFLAPEIYKLDFQIKNLVLRDVNSDGKVDVIIVNNLRNRIDLFTELKDDKIDTTPEAEINEILNPRRMKHRKIPIARNIKALEVADLNGDKRPDFVYLGEPAALYVDYQAEDGTFKRGQQFDVTDLAGELFTIDVGDLNGDSQNDVAFIGRTNLYVAYQREDHRLDTPKKFRLAVTNPGMIRVLDINGDNLKDVVYFGDQNDDSPVRIRLQSKVGKLGPEYRLKIDPPRGISFADIDGKPGEELLIISNLSNRLLVYSLGKAKKEDELPTGKMVTYPFERAGSSPRADVKLADFDGDGKTDIVVSDPDAARLTLFRQTEVDGLNLGEQYPAMLGITELRTADLDGDKKAELLSLSQQERAIGISKFDNNRMTFPAGIPTADEPIAFDLARGMGGAGDLPHRILYLARFRKENGQTGYAIRAIDPTVRERKLTFVTAKLGDRNQLDADFNGNPSTMRVVDVNADGHGDIIFFFDYQPPTVWLGDGKGSYQPSPRENQGTLGAKVRPGGVYFGPLAAAKPEFIVAQSNFARNMQLSDDGRWLVKDQYNIASSSGNIAAVGVINFEKDAQPEIVVYDRDSQSLVFLRQQEGVYRQWQQMKVGAFNEVATQLHVGDFNGDGKYDVLLFDPDKMGIAYAGQPDLEMKQIASYETDLRSGRLGDMNPADLNADGRVDILAIEPFEHHLEVLAVLPDLSIKRVARWKVFQEKTFRRGFAGGVEPRETAIADLNGDGRNDIAILVHDRLLVYLQDDGKEPAITKGADSNPADSNAKSGAAAKNKQDAK